MRVALLLLLGAGDPGMRDAVAAAPPSAPTGEANPTTGLGILERPAIPIQCFTNPGTACDLRVALHRPCSMPFALLGTWPSRWKQLPQQGSPEPPEAPEDCVGPDGILLGEAKVVAAPRPLARHGGLRDAH
jgi:hypothetical protein